MIFHQPYDLHRCLDFLEGPTQLGQFFAVTCLGKILTSTATDKMENWLVKTNPLYSKTPSPLLRVLYNIPATSSTAHLTSQPTKTSGQSLKSETQSKIHPELNG